MLGFILHYIRGLFIEILVHILLVGWIPGLTTIHIYTNVYVIKRGKAQYDFTLLPNKRVITSY